jgi:hypothetical protein
LETIQILIISPVSFQYLGKAVSRRQTTFVNHKISFGIVPIGILGIHFKSTLKISRTMKNRGIHILKVPCQNYLGRNTQDACFLRFSDKPIFLRQTNLNTQKTMSQVLLFWYVESM